MVLIWVCRPDTHTHTHTHTYIYIYITIYVFSFHNSLSELDITDRATAISCCPRVTNRSMDMLFVVMVEIR